MISSHDLYTVLAATIPLYFAIILAYASVRWWKIFTADQCAGINRFVATFAFPFLFFHFISTTNPYALNLRFIAADTIQKIAMLVILGLWTKFTKTGSLDWMITLFSISTLPNTLIIGVPLLVPMYGELSGSLMIQVFLLQCILWYTVLLFLFECRAAKMLVTEKFRETAASIASFKVDSDVVSLDNLHFLETASEIGDDGMLHVTVRKSNSSWPSLEPRSLSAPHRRKPNSSRPSLWLRSLSAPHRRITSAVTDEWENQRPQSQSPRQILPHHIISQKEVPMLVGSVGISPTPEAGGAQLFGSTDLGAWEQSRRSNQGAKEIRMLVADDGPHNGENKAITGNGGEKGEEERERDGLTGSFKSGSNPTAELHSKAARSLYSGARKQMPPAKVMIRLILTMVWRKVIRNPNMHSSLIGLVWSLIAFRWHVVMPKIIENSISIISNTGLGMAMFSLGLFMALQPKIISCGNKVAAFCMVVRFLIGPAVMTVSSIIVGIHGTLLHIAIVQAALPEGLVPFVYAEEYNVHPAILSTVVIFGMFIALPIALVYYIVLGL